MGQPSMQRCVLQLLVGRTQGSETSQYLKEEKSNEIPLVAASEKGLGRLVIAYILAEQVGKLEHRG